MRSIFLILIVLSTFSSCELDRDLDKISISEFTILSEIYYIAPLPPAGAHHPANIPAMKLIEKGSKEELLLTLGQIENFNFEEGNEYLVKLEVKTLANPPIDGHLKEYKLLKIINKQLIFSK